MFSPSRPDVTVFSDDSKPPANRWKGIVGFWIGISIPLAMMVLFMRHGWLYAICLAVSFGLSFQKARRRAAERAAAQRPPLDFGPEPTSPRASGQA